MYTNIPRKEVINIINNILENNIEIETNTREEIIFIMSIIIKQNYSQFDQQYYEQIEGLAMGEPISAIVAEVFIQYMESQEQKKKKILAYYRYVDDILTVYDRQKTNIKQTLKEFNNMQPTIKFTIEKEQQEKINYLDITIQRKNERLEF
jgi:hexokinase